MVSNPPGVGGSMPPNWPSRPSSSYLAALLLPSHYPAVTPQVPASSCSCVGHCPILGVTVGNAQLMLSDHCSLMLSLDLPPPMAPAVSMLPTLCARWEPGV